MRGFSGSVPGCTLRDRRLNPRAQTAADSGNSVPEHTNARAFVSFMQSPRRPAEGGAAAFVYPRVRHAPSRACMLCSSNVGTAQGQSAVVENMLPRAR